MKKTNNDKQQCTATKPPSRFTLQSIIIRIAILLVAIPILIWSYRGAEIRPIALVTNSNNIYTYLKEFISPDFASWRVIVAEMTITVQMAICASFLAIVLAVPLSLLSAGNFAPVWVLHPVRRCMDALRSINPLIFAMVFMVSVGLGPFAGVLALFAHTLGTLAKLFSEAVEAIDQHPVEGIRATGGNKLEQIVYGVIPQVMPLWIAYSLYRFEANVRSASVVGLVGAGGIGFVLWNSIRGFNYSKTAAILIVIVSTVSILDFFSAKVRKQFV